MAKRTMAAVLFGEHLPGARRYKANDGAMSETVPTGNPVSFGAGRFVDVPGERDAQGLLPWNFQIPTPSIPAPPVAAAPASAAQSGGLSARLRAAGATGK